MRRECGAEENRVERPGLFERSAERGQGLQLSAATTPLSMSGPLATVNLYSP
jgi:hypothetical protein